MRLSELFSRSSPSPGLVVIFLIAGVCDSCAKAQRCGADTQSSIATDRPQITNSSVVVPCGSLQFENGFQVTSSDGRRSYDLPETSIRFGLPHKLELRFATPNFLRMQKTLPGLSNEYGDLSLGAERQLGPVRGFDISVSPYVSLPTGSDSVSSHGYDPGVYLPWSRSLTKNWTAAGQFSVGWLTHSLQRNLTGQSSVYFDRKLASQVDAYVEYSGVFPQRGGAQHLIDVGAAYKPTPHQQFDLHLSSGLSSPLPDYTVGVGYSLRLQVIRFKGRSGGN